MGVSADLDPHFVTVSLWKIVAHHESFQSGYDGAPILVFFDITDVVVMDPRRHQRRPTSTSSFVQMITVT